MDPRPVALVTGGAIRVGRSIALHLAAEGYRVWISAHASRQKAQSCRDELQGAGLGVLLADLSQEIERQKLCDAICDPQGPAQGRIDLLVNNAASFERGPFLSREDADLRRVLELNLIAPLSLARRLAPALQKANDPSIINIVDLGALYPSLDFGDHCISKAALWQATRVMALELAPKIRCNAIAPGTVLLPPGPEYAPGSPYHAAILAATPQKRIGSPEDVARSVAFLAANSHITGQLISVDGGRSLGSGVI